MADGSVGIKVLPPDVNISDKDFTPVYVRARGPRGSGRKKDPGKDGVIRFGMMAVRGVGEKAVEAVIAGSASNVEDFSVALTISASALICGRLSQLDDRCADSLRAVFLRWGRSGRKLMNVLDRRGWGWGQQSQNDKRSGQMSMFVQPQATAGRRRPKLSGALAGCGRVSAGGAAEIREGVCWVFLHHEPSADRAPGGD